MQSLIIKIYIDSEHLERVNTQLLEKVTKLESQLDSYKDMVFTKDASIHNKVQRTRSPANRPITLSGHNTGYNIGHTSGNNSGYNSTHDLK